MHYLGENANLIGAFARSSGLLLEMTAEKELVLEGDIMALTVMSNWLLEQYFPKATPNQSWCCV